MISEYWLASLKVATIVVFIIIGVAVNVGGNTSHEFIGGKNWWIGDAPFVGGFGGFARVFVTASFACGSKELPLSDFLPDRALVQTVEQRAWESLLARPKIRPRTCPGLSRRFSGGGSLSPLPEQHRLTVCLQDSYLLHPFSPSCRLERLVLNRCSISRRG